MLEERINERFGPGITITRVELSPTGVKRILVDLNRDRLKDIVRFLVDEELMHLSAITALDIEEGVEVLYHFVGRKILVTLRIQLPYEDCVAPTITDIVPGALLHEREVHDLFGVKFEGNPDLRRLILPEDWPLNIHPMRKRRLE